MKNLHLIVGNNDEALANIAKAMYQDSQLLTNENYSTLELQTSVYTSLADLDHDRIIEVATKATTVHYFAPVSWSSEGLKKGTEELLIKLVKVFNIKVKNFSIVNDPTNSLLQADHRVHSAPQLWIVGCSYAYGVGLRHESQRYANIVSTVLNLPYSDLTSPGASIRWAADQILRADIREGDTVVWGLTGINRIDYYINNIYTPILGSVTVPELRGNFTEKQHEFFDKLITDDNQVNQAIKSIYQVVNFIGKINANLIILNHSEFLSLQDYGITVKQYLWEFDFVLTPTAQIDFTDDGHPGPLTNQLWAKQILDFIKK